MKEIGVPLQDDLFTEIVTYVDDLGLKPSDRLWRWSRRFGHAVISRTLTAVGVEAVRANPRALRHGFAVRCALDRIPLPVIQSWMGHADAKTTSIYLQIVAQDAHEWIDKVRF